METEFDHKIVRLHRSGGSRSLTLPVQWLRRIGLPDDLATARLSLQDRRIIVESAPEAPASIEEDPAFPAFLEFLAQAALRHPEDLVDAGDVLDEDADLVPAVSDPGR